MDLWNILEMMARRWYASVPLVLATIVTALILSTALTSQWSAEGSVIIFPPNETLVEVPVDPDDPDNLETVSELVPINPLVRSVAGVGTAARLVELQIADDRTAKLLDDEGLSVDYVIEQFERNSPILIVTADADTQAVAINTVDRILAIIAESLSTLQDELGAPDTERIGVQVITEPEEAFPQATGRVRTLIAIVVGGGVLSLLIVAAIDGTLDRRDGTDRLDPSSGGATSEATATGDPAHRAEAPSSGAPEDRAASASDRWKR